MPPAGRLGLQLETLLLDLRSKRDAGFSPCEEGPPFPLHFEIPIPTAQLVATPGVKLLGGIRWIEDSASTRCRASSAAHFSQVSIP